MKSLKKVKFSQIVTGAYTYRAFEDSGYGVDTDAPIERTSHCLYGLDEEGTVWKHNAKTNEWIKLEDRN